MVDSLVSKIQTLQNKYNTTFFDVESEIRATEKQLAAMMDDLTGSEYDLKGLSEFKTLLLGDWYGKTEQTCHPIQGIYWRLGTAEVIRNCR